ncbi:MAG: hypothetical protein EOO38_02505 [Cytophagaceae bacterium]|nr:MAG: hypothetical protein EOO38_02505 [Cytophagaceae bacterium]
MRANKTYEEPSSGKGYKVVAVDRQRGTLHVNQSEHRPPPDIQALIPDQPPVTDSQRQALQMWARAIRDGDATFGAAALALLQRRPPALSGPFARGPIASPDTDVAHLRLLPCRLQRSYLPVQGLPGTGKTYLGERMIVSLLQAGHSVSITAHSHSVVSKLLHVIVQYAAGIDLAIGGWAKLRA